MSLPEQDDSDAAPIARTAAYYASFIALGLVIASLGPTVPGLARLTGVSLGAVSTIFVARSGGYLVGSLFGGRLYDRRAGHPILAGCLLAMAVTLALVPLADHIAVLAVVLFAVGLGEGAMDVGVNTLLVWSHPRNVGPWMNALHGFFGIGAFISPLIVARALLIDGTVAWPYWITAALILPSAVWIAFLPSPAVPRHDETAAGARPSGSLIFLIAFLFFTVVGAEVGFGNWIYTYAVRTGLEDAGGAAYLTSAFWGTFTVARLLGIPIAARFRPGVILVVDFLGCAAGAALILLFPASVTALWAGTMLAGAAVASQFATILALAGRAMRISGRVTGWFFVGSSSGAMVVPWIIGQLFDRIDPTVTFLVIIADVLVGLVAFLIFHRRARP